MESRTPAHLSYALMVVALFTGFPLLISALVAYLNRSQCHDAMLWGHYTWIIRTFWWSLFWLVLGSALVFTVLLAIIGYPILGLSWIWLIYRIVRGWLALSQDVSPY